MKTIPLEEWKPTDEQVDRAYEIMNDKPLFHFSDEVIDKLVNIVRDAEGKPPIPVRYSAPPAQKVQLVKVRTGKEVLVYSWSYSDKAKRLHVGDVVALPPLPWDMGSGDRNGRVVQSKGVQFEGETKDVRYVINAA